VVIVETHIFTRLICELLSDEELRRLQLALVLRPEQGALIRGASGLRKVRWAKSGRGKRGGLRVLYYWDKPAERLYMIYVLEKTKKADLTPAQIKDLGRIVREELK
jgi:mRNA-degrading endonuclease RelE of RelBE toxin-antitoxin system